MTKIPVESNQQEPIYDPEFALPPEVISLVNQSILAQSVALAREGNLASAEELLLDVLKQKPSHAVFDLLARVKAQQGDLDSAYQMWEKAIHLNPECTDCRAGLERIRSYRRPLALNNWFKLGFHSSLILISLALISFLLLELGQLSKSMSALQTPSYASVTVISPTSVAQVFTQTDTQDERIMDQLRTNQVNLEKIQTQLNDIQATQTTKEIPTTQTTSLDEIEINVPGVNTRIEGNALVVTFEDGIFLYNWFIGEPGSKALKQVGYQLEPWTDKITIQVNGFTDDREKGDPSLSFNRANSAIRFLVDNTQLTEKLFFINSVSDQPAPFPNNSRDNQLRNRTIVLIVRLTQPQE